MRPGAALVTGAGARLGRAMAEALGAAEEDGAVNVKAGGKGDSLLSKIDLKGMLSSRRKDKVANEG